MTLFVGTTTSITAANGVYVTRPSGVAEGPFSLYADLLATGPIGAVAKGVQIDIKPSATGTSANDHSGIVLNTSGPWQALSAGSGNPLWGHGRGIIFYKDGRVEYERWFVDIEGRANASLLPIPLDWRNYDALVFSAYTNPNGTGEIALYSATGLGGSVIAELWRTVFAPYECVSVNTCVHKAALPSNVCLPIGKGDYAAGFAIGENHQATFRPRAIFN
jgi:hypothetical protein